MSDIENVKSVVISVDRELWKSAKVLAAQQERPVRLVVADGLRLMLKAPDAPITHEHEVWEALGWKISNRLNDTSVEDALGCAPSLTGLSPEEAIRRSR